MGTDIHPYVEYQKDGKWLTGDHWEVDEEDKEIYETPKPVARVQYHQQVYNQRNYRLFAALANVRNDGDKIIPIHELRRLPTDLSPELTAWTEMAGIGEFYSDYHSHNWATLAELLAYDWTQMVTHQGVVEAQEYVRFSRGFHDEATRHPQSYASSVAGGESVVMKPEDFDEKYPDAKKYDDDPEWKGLWVRCQWKRPLNLDCSHFIGAVFPALLAIAMREGIGHDDVRLLYWFDS